MPNLNQLVPLSTHPTGGLTIEGPALFPEQDLVGYLTYCASMSDPMDILTQATKLNGEGILTSYCLVTDHEHEAVYSLQQCCHGVSLNQFLDERNFLGNSLTELDLWKIIVGVSLSIVKLLHNYSYKGITPYAFLTFSESHIYYDSRGKILYRPAYIPCERLMSEKNTIKAEGECVKRFAEFISELIDRYCSDDIIRSTQLSILINKMTTEESARPTFAAICAIDSMGEHIRSSLIEAGLFNWETLASGITTPRESMENTPLFEAIEEDNPAGISNSLEWLKQANLKGRTALMHAAINRFTISAHSNILISNESCCQDCNGWTALMHAIESQYFTLAELLLEREAGFIGVDTSMQLKASGGLQLGSLVGISVLEAAPAVLGRSMSVRLLGSSAHLNTATVGKQSGKMTALILAVRNRLYDAAKYLASFEAGCQDANGNTALMYALQQEDCDEELCKILAMYEGGYVNELDGSTFAFRIAATLGKREICKLLLNKERNLGRSRCFTSLHYAVAVHDDIMFNHYLTKYALSQDMVGLTPLMLACIFNDTEYVDTLLSTIIEARCQQNTPDSVLDVLLSEDKQHLNALDHAILNCSLEAANTLLMRLATELSLPFPLTDSAIISIFQCLGERDLGIRALLDYGKETGLLQSMDHSNTSKKPRHLTSLWFKALEIRSHVALFTMSHLYKKCLNMNGKTALMEASHQGDLRLVKLLSIEAKMTSRQGCTALMYAILQGNDDIVYHLAPLENNIYTSSDYYDGPGITPLELALRHNMTAYIPVLS